MPDAFGGSSLYDLLLFKAVDRYGEDAHIDEDTEGDHMFLNAIARPILYSDEDYLEAVEALKDKAANEKPHGMLDSTWTRILNYEHLGYIMQCLREHGHLDAAPIASSDDGSSFLG